MLLHHRPVGVGVIGAGRWGRNHVRDLARLPGAELRWVCDLDPSALRAAEQLAPTARLTGELERVLDDGQVEAVVVATDSARHVAPALAALGAGKHVLVEKPMTLDPETAVELAAASAARRRLLMVGHLLAYHPAVVRLRRLIEDGELGTVRYLSATRTNLLASDRREAGGVLFSLGPHDLSLVDLLLDAEPVSVTARGVTGADGLTEAAFVNLSLSDGSLAQLHLSWLEPRRQRRLTVVGSRATAVFDDTWSAKKLRVWRAGRVETPELEAVQPLTAECAHFVACAAAGLEPATSAAHGLRVMRWLAAAEAAIGSGMPTPVGDRNCHRGNGSGLPLLA